MFSKKIASLWLFLSMTSYSYPSTAEMAISFNPRDDYQFGVGSTIGGAYGVVGVSGYLNWSSLVNIEVGAGTGLYFDAYQAHVRYLILDHPLTPAAGLGLAYWDLSVPPQKAAQKSSNAVDLGLVKADGSESKGGIGLLPFSIGLNYISDLGLSLNVDFQFMVSMANFHGIPYGGLSFQWYF
ncbi:MAG: hypothetical protein HY390_01255 [Deltaproteobacteria bacterium]|nr:hypothetical protein [Deltaproteobacteria bacterium]